MKSGLSSITSNSNKKNKEADQANQVTNQNTLKNKNNTEGGDPPHKSDRKLSLNSVVSSAGLMSKLRENSVAGASNQGNSVMKGVLDAFKTSPQQPGACVGEIPNVCVR